MTELSLLLALTVLGATAATLGVAGGQLVVQGQQSIAQSNAWANQQNSQWAHYCEENGSQTVGCPGPRVSSGIDQPQGQAGEREAQLGNQILEYSLILLGATVAVAIGYGLILRRARVAGARKSPELGDSPPQ
ncbi:MAG: hypothetical protein L3K18_02400 [Thermoplasmata archaeon]|nr:hypothetical protein [Thermoplasmata archaeon]